MVKLVDYTPAWWSVSDLVLIHYWDSLVCDNCSQGVVTKRIIRAHALIGGKVTVYIKVTAATPSSTDDHRS